MEAPKWKQKPDPCLRCAKDNWNNNSGCCAVCHIANYMEWRFAMGFSITDALSAQFKNQIEEEKTFLEGKDESH